MGTKFGKIEDRVKARRAAKSRFNLVEFAIAEIAEAREVTKQEIYKATKTGELDLRDIKSLARYILGKDTQETVDTKIVPEPCKKQILLIEISLKDS